MWSQGKRQRRFRSHKHLTLHARTALRNVALDTGQFASCLSSHSAEAELHGFTCDRRCVLHGGHFSCNLPCVLIFCQCIHLNKKKKKKKYIYTPGEPSTKVSGSKVSITLSERKEFAYKTLFAPEALYPTSLLHQKPFTSDGSFIKSRLHQKHFALN